MFFLSVRQLTGAIPSSISPIPPPYHLLRRAIAFGGKQRQGGNPSTAPHQLSPFKAVTGRVPHSFCGRGGLDYLGSHCYVSTLVCESRSLHRAGHLSAPFAFRARRPFQAPGAPLTSRVSSRTTESVATWKPTTPWKDSIRGNVGNGRQSSGGNWIQAALELFEEHTPRGRKVCRRRLAEPAPAPALIQKGQAVSRTDGVVVVVGGNEEARPATPRSPAPRSRGRRSLREKSPSVLQTKTPSQPERSRAPRRERERATACRRPSSDSQSASHPRGGRGEASERESHA